MWARSSMGYVLSAKQVACPRYGWYGRSSCYNIGSLTVRTPFWTPLQYLVLQLHVCVTDYYGCSHRKCHKIKHLLIIVLLSACNVDSEVLSKKMSNSFLCFQLSRRKFIQNMPGPLSVRHLTGLWKMPRWPNFTF